MNVTGTLAAGPDGARKSGAKRWITAQVPDELYAELAQQAKLENHSKSHIIRQAIVEHLGRVGAESDG